MRLIIDTQIAVWSLVNDQRLSDTARRMITDPTHEVYISVSSLWEIAIKHRLNRRPYDGIPFTAQQAWSKLIERGYTFLPVMDVHAVAVDDLPLIHRDPFDRLLVAQAMAEPMRLATADAILTRYTDLAIQV